MRNCFASVLMASVVFSCGCSTAPFLSLTAGTSDAAHIQGSAFTGIVRGGQQPIQGASVYLYAVGTGGYGNGSISLLGPASNTAKDTNNNYYVTTGSDGHFSITGDYTCPATQSQVYLYSIGGNPGSGFNSGAALLAAVGTCPANGTLSSSLFVFMDEVSTVATAYAFAGFAEDAVHVASSNTTLAAKDVANAFLAVPNMETLALGTALATTPAGNGTVPQSEINTLADILAACINSTGPGSSECTTLFANAQNGSTQPTDTATAAVNIAHNPGMSALNISNLFSLQVPTAPFQPTLSSAPNDFTIAISYKGGGLNSPQNLAIDAQGNVWVANSGSLSKLGPNGAEVSGSPYTGGGMQSPSGVAVDPSGAVWVTSNACISKFSSSGVPVGTGYTGGGQDSPWQVAIDGTGHVWATNFLSTAITELNPDGTPASGTMGYSGGGLSDPFFVAIDIGGNAWVSNDTTLTELSPSGTGVGTSPFSGGGLNQPGQIAFDANGNVWAPNYTGGTGNYSISEFTSAGKAITNAAGYTGGGLNFSEYLAIDGFGTVWITNAEGDSISEFNSSGIAVSGSNGYTGGGLNNPSGIAIDGSGNIWVPNSGGNGVVEFVGAAYPVVTPIAANLTAPYGTQAVNLP